MSAVGVSAHVENAARTLVAATVFGIFPKSPVSTKKVVRKIFCPWSFGSNQRNGTPFELLKKSGPPAWTEVILNNPPSTTPPTSHLVLIYMVFPQELFALLHQRADCGDELSVVSCLTDRGNGEG